MLLAVLVSVEKFVAHHKKLLVQNLLEKHKFYISTIMPSLIIEFQKTLSY